MGTVGAWNARPSFAKVPGEYKMVLLLPGPINDKSWNAANFAGIQEINKELGTKIEYVENVQPGEYEAAFKKYAESGYDLVLAAGLQFDQAAAATAPKHEKTVFSVINGVTAAKPNLSPVLLKEYEASFLAGIIAGGVTKTGKIGIAGAFPDSLMVRLLNTYVWAARISRPDLKVARGYTNSWTDAALGSQMAASMVDTGADVLFFYANKAALGAIQEARERRVQFIGFAADQNALAPGTVAASVYFDFEKIYRWIIGKFLEGSFKPVVNELGVAEGIVKVAYGDAISSEIQQTVTAAEEALKKRDMLFFLSHYPDKP
ncbi:MAG: BMP family ABC transporter substrate-binding protein [Synergistaceae bacterium]|nr:BMP family ABC transporter substrate-binding protein [Synergistaceae bacterium]